MIASRAMLINICLQDNQYDSLYRQPIFISVLRRVRACMCVIINEVAGVLISTLMKLIKELFRESGNFSWDRNELHIIRNQLHHPRASRVCLPRSLYTQINLSNSCHRYQRCLCGIWNSVSLWFEFAKCLVWYPQSPSSAKPGGLSLSSS